MLVSAVATPIKTCRRVLQDLVRNLEIAPVLALEDGRAVTHSGALPRRVLRPGRWRCNPGTPRRAVQSKVDRVGALQAQALAALLTALALREQLFSHQYHAFLVTHQEHPTDTDAQPSETPELKHPWVHIQHYWRNESEDHQ